MGVEQEFSSPSPSQTFSIDATWKGFTHALSGLFCASLNFMDEAKTVAWSPLTGVSPWNGMKSAYRDSL